ncbi:uncharacterized protein LOC133183563 [Saccostrea echinata]|uniref:uncharacterized protein LOC133183563 n=1 Tax=Saccostrea echinata TaxID=191078 RepID=UPI002A7FAF09|nr:uncharacterized protein LOC133183563 [Saccostrea echinata]
MRKRTIVKPKAVTDAGSGSVQKEDNFSKSRGDQVSNGGGGGGFGKRLLKAVQILILVTLVPPFLNYAALQKEATELKPVHGQLYDIAWGQKIFKMCHGKGPPTVILDAPTGMTSDVWELVWPKIAKISRVCVYDRAGLGFSERPVMNYSQTDGQDAKSNARNRWHPFTVERMADDLNKLITTSSQEGQPFILVGAELGALVAQFYTQMFDNQVAGMLLINPLSDDLFERDSGSWKAHWFGNLIPSFQSMQLGAALGLVRLALLVGLINQPLTGTNIPEDVINRQKHFLCHPKHLSSVVDEYHFMNESFSQIRTMRMLKAVPSNVSVTVLSGNYYDELMPSHLNKAWAKSEQNLLTKYYPRAKHIVINSSDRHMLYRNPDAISEQVIKMIKQVRNKLRIKSS